jgi:Arc/MetJ-type ribon-helix-helix transcriptional regulator
MRKAVTISMPQEMYDYIVSESRRVSVSEYIRSLVRRDQERRADNAARPLRMSPRADETSTFIEALEELEKLKAILERNDKYFD